MSSVVDATDARTDPAAPPTTLPGWLLHHARTTPRAVAYRVKSLGRWEEITWAQHAARVAQVGRALAHHGVDAGDRVLLVSENRVEWVVTDLAVQGLGAVTVATFPSAPVDELHELVRRSRPRLAVVEGEQQLDELLEMSSSPLERIFVIDTRGIRRLEEPAASFEQLEVLGSREAVELRAGDPEQWERSVAALEPDDVATIVFTPGTTGAPKGAMLTHGNLAAAAELGVDAYELRAGDRIVSSMSLCEITERVLVVAQATKAACTVHFGEGGDALERDVREVEPTVFVGAPRLWERFRERVDDGLRDAGRVKRTAFRLATTGRGGLVGFLARVLVTKPLQRHLGLARVRVALVGGAPTPPALLEWWARLGLRARQVYGLTETSGIATVTDATDVGTGRVGRAVRGVDLRLDESAGSAPGTGEVLLRGPVVFAGYLDDDEATKAALDDGWLRTGDIGLLDEDDQLTIIGRLKDVIVTSTGSKVAPLPIERRLTASPYVRDAIVIGEGRPHLGVLVDIDERAVGSWAGEHRVAYTTGASLRARPEVRELLASEIDAVNDTLAEHERIRSFALLPEALDAETGLLTATAKARRHLITARYADLVEGMFT